MSTNCRLNVCSILESAPKDAEGSLCNWDAPLLYVTHRLISYINCATISMVNKDAHKPQDMRVRVLKTSYRRVGRKKSLKSLNNFEIT